MIIYRSIDRELADKIFSLLMKISSDSMENTKAKITLTLLGFDVEKDTVIMDC